MTVASRRRVLLGRGAYWLQRYGLSAAFLWMAYGRLRPYLDAERLAHLVAALGHPAAGTNPLLVEAAARDGLLLAFDLLVAILLLASRPAPRPPERLAHLVLPLLSTFSFLGFGLVGRLPSWAHSPRLLPSLGLWGLIVPEILVLCAYAVSLTALFYLRRSFAIFVEVRELVRRGPYRFVRHPMYLGYVLVVAAICLSRPTPATWLSGALAVALTLWRARLEEQMLVRHAPGYDELMRTTGMIFPRLRRGSTTTTCSTRPS